MPRAAYTCLNLDVIRKNHGPERQDMGTDRGEEDAWYGRVTNWESSTAYKKKKRKKRKKRGAAELEVVK